MTNKQILEIAMKQSAIDSHCDWQDFMAKKNKVVISEKNENARKYLELPFICDLTSYGTNIVASVLPELEEIVTGYIDKFAIGHCFETPNLHELMKHIRPLGYDVCFMAEYSLPDVDRLLAGGLAEKLQRNFTCEAGSPVLSSRAADLPSYGKRDAGPEIIMKVLGPEDFQELYTGQWGNALCEKRRELDVLAVGAYADGIASGDWSQNTAVGGRRLVGLAGASADCASMWQIGVDVLPGYRRKGIASALTSRLAVEILQRDIVPFYCCAWSNIGSIRNAVASGFRPAWVQVTVKKLEEIAEMNGVPYSPENGGDLYDSSKIL